MKLTNNRKNKYLYKFVPFNQYSLQILIDNEFWVGSPDLLNDPFEGDFIIENLDELHNEEVVKILAEYLSDNKFTYHILYDSLMEIRDFFIAKLYEYLNNHYIKIKYGTTSFSKDCKSLKMWSHYADSHKGFIIIFDRKLLEERIIIDKSTKIVDVEYGELPTVKLKLKNNNIEIINDDLLFMKKLREWKSEKEVRIVKKNKFTFLTPRLLEFPKESIVGIIFGHRMNHDNGANTIEIVLHNRKESLKFYRSHKNDKRNKMIFHEVGYPRPYEMWQHYEVDTESKYYKYLDEED